MVRPRSSKELLRAVVQCAAMALVLAAVPAAARAQDEAPPPLWFDDLVDGPELPGGVEGVAEWLGRAVVAGDPDPGGFPVAVGADLATRLLFVSVRHGDRPATVILARGRGLAAAARRALLEVRALGVERPAAIKVDIVEHAFHHPQADPRFPLGLERSLWGVAFHRGVGAAFLPEQLVAYTLLDSDQVLRPRNFVRLLGDESWAKLARTPELHLIRFRCRSWWVDAEGARPLFRGHSVVDAIDPDMLFAAAIRAGAYLEGAVRADGRFVYSYLPKQDREKASYNMLRHAGTTFAMLELYRETGDNALLAAARRALGYLRSKIVDCQVGDVAAACLDDAGFVKLGGNGLAILALAEHAAATGDRADEALIDRLGRWILAVQEDDGHFTVHKQPLDGGPPTAFRSDYYPGEALFGLLRRPQPDPKWLAAAERGAKAIIAAKSAVETASLEHDHWLLYALDELHRQRPSDGLAEHAARLVEAITAAQHRDPAEPDWLGGFYRPPRSTPAAVRAEGLAAAWRLLSRAGESASASAARETAELAVRFALQTQFGPESTLYILAPGRVDGAFHRSLTDFEVRIDYVQHNISALLALRRILSADTSTDSLASGVPPPPAADG